MVEINEKAKGLKDNEVGQSDVHPVVITPAQRREHCRHNILELEQTFKCVKGMVAEEEWELAVIHLEQIVKISTATFKICIKLDKQPPEIEDGL